MARHTPPPAARHPRTPEPAALEQPCPVRGIGRRAQRASLRKQLGVIGKQANEVLQDYAAVVQLIEVEPLAEPMCRDPDDDAVLALARAAQADLIVSGDQDLLVLGQFEGVPIVTPRDALERITQA
ncbi:putative toxin-antitoxin system toxin component, PIN family [Variovorax paradoxus]|uniref:putative toxin-antitoxin system toxin component, PIN family n=1 Tax=Variovorax paradoxus TaxID=34073 RepID=UPI0038CFC740